MFDQLALNGSCREVTSPNRERNKAGNSHKVGSRGTPDRQVRNKREAVEDSRYRQAGSMRRALDTHSLGTTVVASQLLLRLTSNERQPQAFQAMELRWRNAVHTKRLQAG